MSLPGDIGQALKRLSPTAPETHARFMRVAIEQARLALASGEFPVGAVITRGPDIIAVAHNEREMSKDPTAHAELLAIRRAAGMVESWRLPDCTLYVTLEPCPMCAGGIVMARLQSVYFGAYDAQRGCCGSVYRLTEDAAFNCIVPSTGGVLEDECAELAHAFLEMHRR